jgi:prepilin-type N-terminal cleavage/methylation domain-containing protein
MRTSVDLDVQAKGVNQPGFSLVEMMVGLSILVVLVAFLGAFTSHVQDIWMSTRGKIDTSQATRGVFLMMGQELSCAVADPGGLGGVKQYPLLFQAQLVQNPVLASETRLRGTDSLFWQTAVVDTPRGDISSVGYFVNQDRELVRYFATPDIDDRFPQLGSNGAYSLTKTVMGNGVPSSYDPAPLWLNPPIATADFFETRINGRPSKSCSAVMEGVAGLWFRCKDAEGQPIPYNLVSLPASADRVKFDSCFPAAAGRLPSAVECVIAVFDPLTYQRFQSQIRAQFPNQGDLQPEVGQSNGDPEFLASISGMLMRCQEKGIPEPRIYRGLFPIPVGDYRP